MLPVLFLLKAPSIAATAEKAQLRIRTAGEGERGVTVMVSGDGGGNHQLPQLA